MERQRDRLLITSGFSRSMGPVDHRQVKALLDGEAVSPRRGRLKRLASDIRCSRPCAIMLLLFCLLLVLLVHTASPASTTNLQTPNEEFDNIPIHSRADDPRIMILQHIYPTLLSLSQRLAGKNELPLYEVSIKSHQKYARAWGYGYKLHRGSWLSTDSKQSKHLTKVYSLLEAVLKEIDRGNAGAEWIM